MKREFLENFKVGDQPLSKEAIDAIMAENGRDIENAKKPFADYESIKEQLETARKGLAAFDGVDVKDLQGQITKLQGDLETKEREHAAQLADRDFQTALKDAITSAKGRSTKAITAMLDVDTLKASKNQAADIKTALETLQKDSGYLFESDETPPPYSAGAGSGASGGGVTSLDAAIRAAAGLGVDKK